MPVSRVTTSMVAKSIAAKSIAAKSIAAKSIAAKSMAARSMAASAFALALGVVVQPGTGLAYTPEQQQACTPDAMNLCGEFIPNVDAITACMIRKKAQLSPQCAAFFRRGPEPGEVRAGAPTNIKPVAARKTKPKAKKKKTADG